MNNHYDGDGMPWWEALLWMLAYFIIVTIAIIAVFVVPYAGVQ